MTAIGLTLIALVFGFAWLRQDDVDPKWLEIVGGAAFVLGVALVAAGVVAAAWRWMP